MKNYNWLTQHSIKLTIWPFFASLCPIRTCQSNTNGLKANKPQNVDWSFYVTMRWYHIIMMAMCLLLNEQNNQQQIAELEKLLPTKKVLLFNQKSQMINIVWIIRIISWRLTPKSIRNGAEILPYQWQDLYNPILTH